MPKPNYIELGNDERIPILYEDRSVMAIDKPCGWLLVPHSWQKTNRNLPAAIASSMAAGSFWARSRNLRYLRNIHRLDGDTSGILLMAKSPGGLNTYGDLFETRKMEKIYLAVIVGTPKQSEWVCRLKLAPDPDHIGQIKVDARQGKEAETSFKVLQSKNDKTLIEARPYSGRTHQIRVHLAETAGPILGDPLYGGGKPVAKPAGRSKHELALRAVYLAYPDPFLRRQIHITAPTEDFIRDYGFDFTWRAPGRESAGLNPRSTRETPEQAAQAPLNKPRAAR